MKKVLEGARINYEQFVYGFTSPVEFTENIKVDKDLDVLVKLESMVKNGLKITGLERIYKDVQGIYILCDYSYSLNGDFSHYPHIGRFEGYGDIKNGTEYIILKEGLKIPHDDSLGLQMIDTQIQSLKTGRKYYVQKRFLKDVDDIKNNRNNFPFSYHLFQI